MDRLLTTNEGTRSLITNPALTNPSNPDGGIVASSIRRRTLIGGALGGALAALLGSSQRAMADIEGTRTPNDPFILLLKGVYQDVPRGYGQPNLGLTTVDLDDGSYSRTKIYPVFGLPESRDQDGAIGKFYVQFSGNLCAYDLPGGAIAMQFLPVPAPLPDPNPLGYNAFVPFSDGLGGYYLEGTWELTILEATGIYRDFQGGHNHMVDRLHQLANGQFDELCFCNISQYQFP